MSKFASSYAAGDRSNLETSPDLLAFQSEYPHLLDAMLGTKDVEGKAMVPPCTLMLFVEVDRVKFCLSPKWGDKIAFGTLRDPSKGLNGIEEEISEGRFEWKKRGKRG